MSLSIAQASAGLSRGGGVAAFVRELADAQETEPEVKVSILLGNSGGADMLPGLVGTQIFEGTIPEGTNVVHGHGIWLPFNHRVQQTTQKQGIPFLLSAHGMLEPGALRFSKWKKKVVMALWQRRDLFSADVLHATAPEEAETFRSFGLTQPICVLPPGVQIPNEDEMSMHSGSADKVKTALFMSRLHPKKNLPLFLEVWARVQPKGWQLRIVGPDQSGHAEELKRLAQKLGIEDFLSIEDALYGEAKAKAFQQADLFVLPSLSENFGIVVPEALAYGVPCIATTPTPWRELQEHDCGWWVDPTAEALAGALSDATTRDADERKAMGLRGRALVESKYQWPAIAQDMLATYDWMLGNGLMPECVV